jgi:hypothetical protein
MLARAYGAGLLTQASWVTADEAYGQNPTFRAWLAIAGSPVRARNSQQRHAHQS